MSREVISDVLGLTAISISMGVVLWLPVILHG